MIRLDLTTAVFLYVLFSVIAILIGWAAVLYGRPRRFSLRDVDVIWKCPVCLNVYVFSENEEISVCSVCGSYNKREE